MPDPSPHAAAPDAAIERLTRTCAVSDAFKSATRALHHTDDVTMGHQTELTLIPSPPFGEAARAERFSELLEEAGAENVSGDDEGNVIGWVGAAGSGPPIVVAAHLDTVFPAGTPIGLEHVHDRIVGPGISDDARGLAGLLAAVRTLTGGVEVLGRPLMCVGTVGEEGVGDLRGVRHLFRDGAAARSAAAFVSLDGAGHARIVDRGVGSRRFRIRLDGPGGHSWADWGTANPLHALARSVTELTERALPLHSTLTVARMAGGLSVNAIPSEAWMELDVRSSTDDALADLESSVREATERAVAEADANRRSGTARLALHVERIGSRPAGRTRESHPLVRAAVGATHHIFGSVELVASSTDANVPMQLGIPAITMGVGGEAGLAHTVDEWYRNVRGPEGIARALLTLMVLDRLLQEA